jgi:hypothetical protein
MRYKNEKIAVALEIIGVNLPIDELLSKLKLEFSLEVTKEDVNVVLASYTVDNFEIESKKVKFYEGYPID